MIPTSHRSHFFFHSRPTSGLFLRMALAGLVAGVCASAHGQIPVYVPNYSFENPTAIGGPGSVYPGALTGWTQTPDTGALGPGNWQYSVGIFSNTNTGNTPDNHIYNLDYNQAAYIINTPTNGFYELLPATYDVGSAYTLGFGTISEASAGSTLLLQAYYLDGTTIVPFATDTVSTLGSGQDTGGINYLQFSSVNIPTVTADDAWAGQQIGIEISVGTVGAAGGEQDWDVDDVTLTVPEPATGGLLAFGFGALLFRRRRTAA